MATAMAKVWSWLSCVVPKRGGLVMRVTTMQDLGTQDLGTQDLGMPVVAVAPVEQARCLAMQANERMPNDLQRASKNWHEVPAPRAP